MKKQTNSTKGKYYENKTFEILNDLNPGTEAYKNIYIKGKLSKGRRQVDIKIVDPHDYQFLLWECKNHSTPIDVKTVEEIPTFIKDVGAKKGAVVSNSPYTTSAINLARAMDIDLLSVIDTSDSNIRTKLYASTKISDSQVAGFYLKLGGIGDTKNGITIEPKDLQFIVRSNGKTATAYEIFASLWNNTEALSRIPGKYVYTPPSAIRKILDVKGNPVTINELQFIYDVIEKHYIGETEIIEAKGIYDVLNNSFRTKSMTTEQITPYEKEKIWPEIDPETASKTMTTMGMSISSMYPIKEAWLFKDKKEKQ